MVEAIATFLDMGGYAAFVWPALGITALVLAAMALASVRRLRASEAALRRAEAAHPRRAARAGEGP